MSAITGAGFSKCYEPIYIIHLSWRLSIAKYIYAGHTPNSQRPTKIDQIDLEFLAIDTVYFPWTLPNGWHIRVIRTLDGQFQKTFDENEIGIDKPISTRPAVNRVRFGNQKVL